MSNSYNEVIGSGRKEGVIVGMVLMGIIWALCAYLI